MLAAAEKLVEDFVGNYSAEGVPYPKMVADQIKRERAMKDHRESTEEIIEEVSTALSAVNGTIKDKLMSRLKNLFKCEVCALKSGLRQALKDFLVDSPLMDRVHEELELLLKKWEELKEKEEHNCSC